MPFCLQLSQRRSSPEPRRVRPGRPEELTDPAGNDQMTLAGQVPGEGPQVLSGPSPRRNGIAPPADRTTSSSADSTLLLGPGRPGSRLTSYAFIGHHAGNLVTAGHPVPPTAADSNSKSGRSALDAPEHRAIDSGDKQSLTVTRGPNAPQVRPCDSPDRTDSRADSTSFSPVDPRHSGTPLTCAPADQRLVPRPSEGDTRPEDVPAFVELESGGPPPGACRVVGVGQPPSHPMREGDRREQHLPEGSPPCPA